MFLDTAYENKDRDQIINDLVGKHFTVFQMLKMKCNRSKRMIIDDVSPELEPFVNKGSDLTYAYIELRPNGVLIRINQGRKHYTWVIPYYHLVIFKTNGLSIHAQGKFIRFKNDQTNRNHKSFFGKLLNEKVKHDLQYDFL